MGFYYVLSFLLISISVYHFTTTRSAFKRLIAVNILGSGVFLFFVATAKNTTSETPDPVPHALVLTGIVVAVTATALAVSLLTHLSRNRERKQ